MADIIITMATIMIELLAMPWMQRAIAAGFLVALLSSYYGAFVVQRGMGFMASGLAHAAFGGVALGIFLGKAPLAAAVPFTVVVALLIMWLKEKSRLGADTTIGIFFALSMAIGIILLSETDHYSADAFTYLFGSILAVSRGDLITTGVVVALSLFTIPLWGRWAYATSDRELAKADGVNVVRDDYVLAVCLAVTIVVAMKVVGIVLVSSFAVIPAATARLVSRRFVTMTVASVLFGILSCLGGLLLSVQMDWPSGSCIVLAQCALFFGAMVVRRR